jgi:hypothetical protein
MPYIISAFLRQDTATKEVEVWYEVLDDDGEFMGKYDTEKEARTHAPDDGLVDWEEVRYRQRLAGQAW